MKTFGERFREWRTSKGVSLYRLAMKYGIPQPNMTSIEKGRRPAGPETLSKLASVPELEITYAQMRVWQLLEKASAEELSLLKTEIENL